MELLAERGGAELFEVRFVVDEQGVLSVVVRDSFTQREQARDFSEGRLTRLWTILLDYGRGPG